MATKKVAAKAASGLPVVGGDRPDWATTPEGSLGRGNEGVTIADVTIPRLELIQDLSPQRKKTDPQYIPGAEEGMLFNTVTKALYGESVIIVPVFFRLEYVIWKDRKKGGGFKGAYPIIEAAKTELAKLEDADDCEIMDTGQQFIMLYNKEAAKWEEAVISCSRTRHRFSRQLNTLARMTDGDRFSCVYEVSAIPAQNSVGQDYFNMDVKKLGWAPEEVYHKAEGMYDAVKAGARDVARDTDATSNEEDDFDGV